MEVLTLPLTGLLLLFAPWVVPPSHTGFVQDSAYAVLRTLAVDIGPRPMGSPAEQRAMQFAVDKLRDAGCSDAYIMPMAVADGVNTTSGIAVGVLRGRSNRIILIGGHLDSAGPDVPGANDDGSGAACVLELARVLCTRDHESTLMFCFWGGEEQGLEGSKYFVDHFQSIDSVDLMIQIDMADGASCLEIDPDYQNVSAPRWLVKAAYEVFYEDLHERDLVYPVASAIINGATGGATGSDHDAFLEKGIPAIDFTSDVNYPIHTPQDNLENFTPSGLKKTGDLVLKLVDRFDHGVPSRSLNRYMLIQLGTKTLFVEYWMLWTVVAISLLFAVSAFLVIRGRSLMRQSATRIRWSGIKLVVYTLVIQVFIWESETVLGWISGYRFPWVNHFAGVAVLGVLSGTVGLWLVLNIMRRFHLSMDASVFGWRALAILVIMTGLSSLAGPKLAAFFACATAFLSLAILLRSTPLRLAFWLLALLTLVRLLFFEELGLIQRILSWNTISSFGGLIGYEFAFIVLFTFMSLPLSFGFAAIYRDSGKDLLWLQRFRNRGGIAAVLPAILLVAGYLFMTRPYGPEWFGRIMVRQEFAAGSDSCRISLQSSEYLRGLTVAADTGEITYDDRANFCEFIPPRRPMPTLCVIDARSSAGQSDTGNVSVRKMTREVTIHSVTRPYRVQVRYSSALPFDLSSPWAYQRADRFQKESDRVGVFTWYSFPDTLLDIPVTFSLRDTQLVQEKIEVLFDTLAYPMRLAKDLTDFEMRTVVTQSNEFQAPKDSTTLSSHRQ